MQNCSCYNSGMKKKLWEKKMRYYSLLNNYQIVDKEWIWCIDLAINFHVTLDEYTVSEQVHMICKDVLIIG
jgi:hypothetical protein